MNGSSAPATQISRNFEGKCDQMEWQQKARYNTIKARQRKNLTGVEHREGLRVVIDGREGPFPRGGFRYPRMLGAGAGAAGEECGAVVEDEDRGIVDAIAAVPLLLVAGRRGVVQQRRAVP